MRAKSIRQSDLTADCFGIQFWGLSACDDCEYLDTEECGGQAIREALLAQGQCGKVGVDGLPGAEEEQNEAQ